MPVQIHHIRYVIAAVENGSFRRAASTLSVQESALSRRIGELEARLGVPLFVRNHCGVKPTEAGEQFVRRGRNALEQIQLALAEVRSGAKPLEGTLRIGIFSSLASGFLADLIRTFGAAYPNVQLAFTAANPAKQVAAVRRFELDIAFLTGTASWDGCEVQPLWSERVFVVLSDADPRGDAMTMHLPDLRNDRFIVTRAPPGEEIHDFLIQHLAALGHHPDIVRHDVGRDDLIQLVALGRGLTLTSEATIAAKAPGVRFLPLAEELLPFSAVWASRNENPALLLLLETARQLSLDAAYHPTAEPET